VAAAMADLFVEVLLAPGFDADAAPASAPGEGGDHGGGPAGREQEDLLSSGAVCATRFL
jgi:hypothetical protein